MSADLLIAGLWARTDTALDFEAGRHAVALLTDTELEEYALAVGGDLDEEEPAEVRAEILTDLADLAVGTVGPQGPDSPGSARYVDIESRVSPDGRWVFFCSGGQSWGEDPTPEYRVIANLGYLPGVLAAVGFQTADNGVLTGG